MKHFDPIKSAFGFTSFHRDTELTLGQQGYVLGCLRRAAERRLSEEEQLAKERLDIRSIRDFAALREWRGINRALEREDRRLARLKWGASGRPSTTEGNL